MARLQVDVDVNVKGADKLSSLGGTLQRTGFNLTKFVTVPLLGIGAASVAMAADAEKSSAKLAAAFRNMGRTSGKSLAELEQQAIDLGEATTFDDEGIMEAQAALLSFGAVSGESFDRAIQGAADYAAATDQDLTAATRTLGKVLADPVAGITRLTRAGVILTEQQKEQVTAFAEAGDTISAQNVILSAFEERYKGVNEQLANTSAGQAAQAFEDLQNAGEDIGAVFLPILAQLAQFVSGLAQAFLRLDPGLQQFIVIAGGVVAAVGPLVFVAGKLIGAFRGVIVVFNLLKVALLTNPFTLLAIAVAAIAALIILNWDKIWKFLSGIWDKIKKAVGVLADFFADVWEGITSAAETAWNRLGDIIRGAVNVVIDVLNGFFGFLNGFQIGIPEINVGPVHIGGGVIDPFNIGLIPHLAQGGIVNSPTLALLGENGPEAVIPLNGKTATETHFHSHIEVRGEEPFISNEQELIRANQRIAFLAGF